jgi:hypothetical protein
MIIHSSFPDFILFLYVHIARSDSYYDPREISAIKEKMFRLFPKGTDLEKKLYRAIREYNSFDVSRMSELLRDSFKHFTNDEETVKTKLFSDVREIIRADEKILPTEREAYRTIRRIVGHA